jgi:hypothetical protein
MFRLKISLTHVIVVALLVGSVHYLMGSHITGEVEQRAESSLRRAAVIAEQTKRFDHFALQEKGRMVANDADTYDFLTLEREALLEEINDENPAILQTDVGKKLGEGDKKDVDAEGGENLSTKDLRHLAVDFRLRVAKHRFDNIQKDTSDSQRNLDLGLRDRRPVRPDMVMALNGSGIGVAALGRDRYHWGSSSLSPNVAKQHPIVQRVLDNPDAGPRLDVWSWSWGPGDDPSLYQVAIVPIRSAAPDKQPDPAGVAVVGYTIHDGAAEEIQRLVGGVTTQEGKQTEHVESSDIESAPEVAFFHGEQLHSSTLDSKRHGQLEQQLFQEKSLLEQDNFDPERTLKFELDGKSYISFVRFLPNQQKAEKKTGVLVTANMDEAKAPIQKVLSQFNMIALALGLIGIGFLLFFYYQFIRPAGQLEETIAEILSGDKDAEFFVTSDDEVFSSLAQGLNLMSAYLQGKPMPDDESELEGWGDMVDGPDGPGGGGSGGASGGGGSPDVQGVQMPGMGPDDDSSDDKS